MGRFLNSGPTAKNKGTGFETVLHPGPDLTRISTVGVDGNVASPLIVRAGLGDRVEGGHGGEERCPHVGLRSRDGGSGRVERVVVAEVDGGAGYGVGGAVQVAPTVDVHLDVGEAVIERVEPPPDASVLSISHLSIHNGTHGVHDQFDKTYI
jgi:hypothetical protein